MFNYGTQELIKINFKSCVFVKEAFTQHSFYDSPDVVGNILYVLEFIVHICVPVRSY